MRAIKIGDVVCVVFLDHCSRVGSDPEEGALLFEAFGRVVKMDKKSVTIASWCYPGGVVLDNNTELFVILKSTIEHIRRLR